MIEKKVINGSRQLISSILIGILVFSSFAMFFTPVYADIVKGSSGTIGGVGFPASGGIHDLPNPIIRVGIQTGEQYFDNGTKEAYDAMMEHHNKYIAINEKSTMYFIDDSDWSTYNNRTFAIAYYMSGSGTLQCVSDGDIVSRIRPTKSDTSRGQSLYRDLLKDYTTDGSNGTKRYSELTGGKWKNIADQKDWTTNAFLWSFLLNKDSADKIADRVNKYVAGTAASAMAGADLYKNDYRVLSGLGHDEKEEITRGYIDLMISGYAVAPKVVKDKWAAAIEAYLKSPNDKKNAPAIVFDAVIPFSLSTGPNNIVVLPVVDYYMYMGGITTNNGLTRRGAIDPSAYGSIDKMIITSVNKSVVESPTRERIAKAFNRNNAFSYAEGAIRRDFKYLRASSNSYWKNNTTGTWGPYYDLFHLKRDKSLSTYMYASFNLGSAPVKTELILEASPKMKLVKVPLIGEMSELTVMSRGSDVETINAWMSKLSEAGNETVNVKLQFKREVTVNIEPTSSPTTLGGTYGSPDGDYITAGVTMSKEQFLEFIRGNKPLKLTDTSVVNHPIDHSQTVYFNYNVTMIVGYKENGNPVEYNSGESDYAWADFRTIPEIIDPIVYTSKPSAYAEIKEGSPYNETFEAMAGVPSTERLYLGVGGSEFVVDIQLEYKQDMTAWRTYHSYYTSVDCEYKAPDTAHAIGAHGGQRRVAVGSGSIPIHGSAPPKPPPTPITHIHTAGSDGITRTITESVSNDDVIVAPICGCSGHGTDSDGNSNPCPAGGHCLDAPGSFSYAYIYTVANHSICGPCCQHVLPQVNDTWKQSIDYDILRITGVDVWKIEAGNVDGMTQLIGTDEIRATIKQGDPSLFFNLADTETSKDGRFRYSVEPEQHDAVTWNEGTRTNKCNKQSEPWGKEGILYNNTGYTNEVDYHKNNSTEYDKTTPEFGKFDERRTTQNVATVISDMLILQTSSGDQSVIYFDKDSESKQTQENFPKVVNTKPEMWDNNSLSAAKWDEQQINVGSYNSNFRKTSKKYDGYNQVTKSFPSGNKVKTKFDSYSGNTGMNDPAKTITRPSRQTDLRIYEDEQQILYYRENRSYITGDADVFYKHILNDYRDGAWNSRIFPKENVSKYGGIGFTLDAPYSDNHTKVNDIIIHTPVSVQDAIVVGLPEERDQRSNLPLGTAEAVREEVNKLKVCPLDPALCEFRILNCHYYDDTTLAEFDFSGGKATNSITGKTYTLPSGFTINNDNRFGSGGSLACFGTRWSIPFKDIGLTTDGSNNIYVEMDIQTGSTLDMMVVSFYGYDFYIPNDSSGYATWNTGNGWERRVDRNFKNQKMKLGLEFSRGSVDECKLYINGSLVNSYTRVNESKNPVSLIGNELNIGSWGLNSSYPAKFWIDNLKIVRKGGSSTHTASCYADILVHGAVPIHEHNASCYASSDIYACNNLPLNSSYSYDCNNLPLNDGIVYDCTLGEAHECPNCGATSGFYQHCTSGCRECVCGSCGTHMGHVFGTSNCEGGGNSGTWYHTSGCSYAYETHVTTSRDECTTCGHSCGYLASWGHVHDSSCSHHFTTHTHNSSCGYTPKTHTHNASCQKVPAGTLICGYKASLNSSTENNVHIYGSGSPTYIEWACGNQPLNSGVIYDCGNLPLNAGYVDIPATTEFNYTGGVQTFTAPISGTYTFEVWGAQGGHSQYDSRVQGGLGGYSKGQIALNQGETVSIYVGGQGGYNGGGSGSSSGAVGSANGGGASDVRRGGTALGNRIIVAGGGGGCEYQASPGNGGTMNSGPFPQYGGGHGGGTAGLQGLGDYTGSGNGSGGTQTSGYALGQGQPSMGGHSGAGGGGYYGGYAGSTDNHAGGGGSGYIGGVTGGSMQTGIRSGDGYAKITYNGTTGSVPTIHTHNSSCAKHYTSHVHNSSCAKVTKYSSLEERNVHVCLSPYESGVRTYTGIANEGGKKLKVGNSGATMLPNGSFSVNKSSFIYGVEDAFQGGMYRITVKGRNLSSVNFKVSDAEGAKNFDLTRIKNTIADTTFLLNVLNASDNMRFETLSGASSNYTIECIEIEPINLKTPYLWCSACSNNVRLKTVGTKILCDDCGKELYDLGERITILSATEPDGLNGYGQRVMIGGVEGKKVIYSSQTGRTETWSTFGKDGNSKTWGDYFYYNTAKTSGCVTKKVLSCTEPHHFGMHYDGSNDICWDACGIDANHQNYKPVITTPTGVDIPNGDFVNLDYPFQVYFPNIGDFQGTNEYGIASLSAGRGKGYVDRMDTTKWTREKRVKFDFNVIYDANDNGDYTDDKLYLAGEWIELPVLGDSYPYYNFYCVLANYEAKAANIEYEVEAINCIDTELSEFNYPDYDLNVPLTDIGTQFNDNLVSETNRNRFSDYMSYHGGYKSSWIDVVGRIGNFVATDTEDYRFSNLFKQKIENDWLIEGFVNKIYPHVQNEYFGDTVDIRGIKLDNTGVGLNTYGSDPWAEKDPIKFPITPDVNNIPQLINQPMRVGYNSYTDIMTTGNYQRGALQVIPYYYALDLNTGQLDPVDVYATVDGVRKPINLFGYTDVDDGEKWRSDEAYRDKIYKSVVNLNWLSEATRRNYTMSEKFMTETISQYLSEPVYSADGETVLTNKNLDIPLGRYYNLGTSQYLMLQGKARTFVGTSKTYNNNYNIDSRIADTYWYQAAQKWYFKVGLPSSSVFVYHGEPAIVENINKVMTEDKVILATVDIQAIGDTYALRYTQKDVSTMKILGKTYTIPDNIPAVVQVMSADKSSIMDVDLQGTH